MIDIFTDERIDHLNQADEFFQKKQQQHIENVSAYKDIE